MELARNDLLGERYTIALPPIDIFNPNRSLPPLERRLTRNSNEPQNFIGVYAQDLISIGDDPVNPRLSVQVGEQRSRGIEFDIAGQILPGWNIIASYSHIFVAALLQILKPGF